jgi:hypothetical protein
MLGGLSFESPDHREMLAYLGRLVAYYRQEVAKKFLCYGQLMRPLAFKEPDPMPRVSYAADGQTIEQPALLSGVFRSQDGELGIFIVNMGGSEVSFLTEVDLARAGMPVPMAVDVESISPEGDVQPYAQNIRDRVVFRGRLPARHVTMFRVKEHR